ncbi:HDOD domain-containing protein [bacterium]|nr:HDOD domain-containing protein [bacterium]
MDIRVQEALATSFFSLPDELQELWDQRLREVKPPPLGLGVGAESMSLENFDARQLAQVVSHDPILAGKILSVANSARYAPAQPITAVQRALVHIGFVMARTIISSYQLEVSFARMPDIPRSHIQFVRQWSAVSAVLSQHWAQASDIPDHATVSTLALLSRIGTLMLGYGEGQGKVAELYLNNYQRYPDEITRLQFEQENWGITTPCLSAELARRWKLPSPLPELLLRQWQPLVREQHDTPDARSLSIACASVALAFGFIRISEFSPELLLEQPAYSKLGENLHNLRLLHSLNGIWRTVRVQRELASAASE